MSKRQLIILLGVLIIVITLFSGLPTMWNNILYIAIGLGVIGIAYTTKPFSSTTHQKNTSVPYVDNHTADTQVTAQTITPVETGK